MSCLAYIGAKSTTDRTRLSLVGATQWQTAVAELQEQVFVDGVFKTPDRVAMSDHVVPKIVKCASGLSSGQGSCFIVLGHRTVGKSFFVKKIMHTTIASCSSNTVWFHLNLKDIACKDFKPLLEMLRSAVCGPEAEAQTPVSSDISSSDIGSSSSDDTDRQRSEVVQNHKVLRKLQKNPWWTTAHLNDYCSRHRKTIFITVDELERAYMSNEPSAQHFICDLHSIGDINGKRRIMCIATGSSPLLRQLAFKKLRSDSSDSGSAEDFLRAFPGAKDAPDLNSRKYLGLTLRPCRSLAVFRECLRVCSVNTSNRLNLQSVWRVEPKHLSLAGEDDGAMYEASASNLVANAGGLDGDDSSASDVVANAGGGGFDRDDSSASDVVANAGGGGFDRDESSASDVVAASNVTDPVADAFLQCRGLVGAAMTLTNRMDDEGIVRLRFRCIDQSGAVEEAVMYLARQYWKDKAIKPLSLVDAESAVLGFSVSLVDCPQWSQSDCYAMDDAGLLRCVGKAKPILMLHLSFVHPADLMLATVRLLIDAAGSELKTVEAWSLMYPQLSGASEINERLVGRGLMQHMEDLLQQLEIVRDELDMTVSAAEKDSWLWPADVVGDRGPSLSVEQLELQMAGLGWSMAPSMKMEAMRSTMNKFLKELPDALGGDLVAFFMSSEIAAESDAAERTQILHVIRVQVKLGLPASAAVSAATVKKWALELCAGSESVLDFIKVVAGKSWECSVHNVLFCTRVTRGDALTAAAEATGVTVLRGGEAWWDTVTTSFLKTVAAIKKQTVHGVSCPSVACSCIVAPRQADGVCSRRTVGHTTWRALPAAI